jgi:hypothetical protein
MVVISPFLGYYAAQKERPFLRSAFSCPSKLGAGGGGSPFGEVKSDKSKVKNGKDLLLPFDF